MAYGKKYSKRRAYPRKRRAYKKRPMGKISRSVGSRPHLFTRLGNRTLIYNNGTTTLSYVNNDSGFALGTQFNDTITGTYGVGFSHIFRLSQMPGYTDFTSLFDKYKICKIVYTIMFQCNQAPINGSSVLPILHLVSDDDDNTIPSGLGELQQRSGCKRRVLGNTVVFKYTFRPKVASAVYNTPVSTAYAIKGGYINSDYSDVPHYGIKGLINNLMMTTNNSIGITIEPKYYLALREVK